MALIIPPYATATFEGQANWDNNDVLALQSSEIGTGVVTGCVVSTTTGMKVKTSAGNVALGAVEFAVAAATTLTIAAATTHDRKDIIVVSTAGAVSVVRGTACTVATWNATSNATPPEEPAVPATSVRLGSIYVVGTAGGHGTTTVASTNITDKTTPILTTPGQTPNTAIQLPQVTRSTRGALAGAWTYNNGTAGVGATLTKTTTGTITINGANPTVGQRIAVTTQASKLQNGIYTVTTKGAATVHAVLTRATTANTSGKLGRAIVVRVKSGSLPPNYVAAFSPETKTFTIGTTAVAAIVVATGYGAFPNGVVGGVLSTGTRIVANSTSGTMLFRPQGPLATTNQLKLSATGQVLPTGTGGFVTKTCVVIRTAITASSGTAFQVTASHDTEIFFGVTLAGTITVSYAATSAGTANSLLSSFAVVAGSTFTKRIPAGWYVKITLTTATITTVKVQTV